MPSKTEQVANLRKAKAERAEAAERAKPTARRKPTPKTTKKAAVDRSPLAVGTFIAREGGASMAELEQEFKMAAHPLRAKIFAARHQLKFTITYDAGKSRYFGKAPRRKAA
jgi:hypothetical protein